MDIYVIKIKNFQAMYLVHDQQSEMLIKLNLLPSHCSGEYKDISYWRIGLTFFALLLDDGNLS